MALVLRKAVLPKNASFLKCLKGRPLATVTNKKNTAPISKAATLQPVRQQPQNVVRDIQLMAVRTVVQQKEESWKNRCPVRKSCSCPCFSRRQHFDIATLSKSKSQSAIGEQCLTTLKFQSLRSFCISQREYSSTCKTPVTPLIALDMANEIKAACSACVCPPGCCSLPPPCNHPAKCLQNITGYYYYPYGTWFCGPYHIKTGPCGPCVGPVQPGGPCGPAPPNPGGPCGPTNVVLCGPGAKCSGCCGPCSPCGPCGNCALCNCGFYGPYGCGPCGPCGPCYDPYSPCGLTGACAPCGLCGSYSICNGPCGPCYNVPCKPIQVCGPVQPGGPCGPKLISNPLDLCSKCCLYRPSDSYSLESSQPISCYETTDKMSPDLDNSPTSPEQAGLKQAAVSAPSRLNIYPSLGHTKSTSGAIAKLHHSAQLSTSQVQVRNFTTLITSNTKNDLQTPETKDKKTVPIPATHSFHTCCNGAWSSFCPMCSCTMSRRLCPPVCKPRYIPCKEERDSPYVPPNCFSYSNTPPYKNPTPYTDVMREVYCKQPWS